MEKIIIVKGMTCNHCKMTVEKGLNNILGIKVKNIDITTGKVELEIENEAVMQEIKDVVDDLGYDLEM